jgi:hypothetical protein
VPLGHLSYSALDAFKRCGYRFYVERVLGVRAGVVTGPVAGDEAPADEGKGPDPAADELVDPEAERTPSAALALGNAVHAALEWSGRTGWQDPGEERIAALLEREGVSDAEATARARRLVSGWLASPLRAELEGMRLRPEAPFVLPLGGTILRGSMDLLARGDGEIAVVDFKTDRVGPGGTVELGARYAAQRAVYALAAAGAEADTVRAAHVFLERPAEPVVEVFDPAALAAARDRLEALIARIRAGEFEVTREPFPALCFGCPAAPRLCPRPAWRPARDAPAAVR